MRPTRRGLLIGGGAVCVAAAVPLVLGGLGSFLRRTTAEQFGEGMLSVDGVAAFIDAFAAQAGDGNIAKRAGAEAYFAFRGDLVREIDQARELKARFLQTILTRSNIIEVWRGEADRLDFTDADPWQPVCGLYLSAFADKSLRA